MRRKPSKIVPFRLQPNRDMDKKVLDFFAKYPEIDRSEFIRHCLFFIVSLLNLGVIQNLAAFYSTNLSRVGSLENRITEEPDTQSTLDTIFGE